MGATNFDEYRDVFVVADTIDDVVHPVTYELIGQARRIAKELGQLVQVMLLGEHVQTEAEELVAHGADIVHVFESPLLRYYTTDGYTKVLTDFFEDHKPNILLIGATNNGRDLAPRMSGRMQNGVVADCTILTVDTEEGLVEWTRPALGGNILAEIISFIPFSKTGYNIQEADIIVAGGRGMGSKENFDKLYELADAIGGVVGATRPLVEKGWIELPYQVGQTGKTVSPKLYLAFGISGAIQHVSGISGADTIVAINNDPKAEIFQYANYGIVGDCMEVLNDMLAHLK